MQYKIDHTHMYVCLYLHKYIHIVRCAESNRSRYTASWIIARSSIVCPIWCIADNEQNNPYYDKKGEQKREIDDCAREMHSRCIRCIHESGIERRSPISALNGATASGEWATCIICMYTGCIRIHKCMCIYYARGRQTSRAIFSKIKLRTVSAWAWLAWAGPGFCFRPPPVHPQLELAIMSFYLRWKNTHVYVCMYVIILYVYAYDERREARKWTAYFLSVVFLY